MTFYRKIFGNSFIRSKKGVFFRREILPDKIFSAYLTWQWIMIISWIENSNETCPLNKIFGIVITGTPCASAPCYNGGSCRNIGSSSFECSCPAGFLGDRCEIKGKINFVSC